MILHELLSPTDTTWCQRLGIVSTILIRTGDTIFTMFQVKNRFLGLFGNQKRSGGVGTSDSGQNKNQANENGDYRNGVTVGSVEVKHLYIYNIFLTPLPGETWATTRRTTTRRFRSSTSFTSTAHVTHKLSKRARISRHVRRTRSVRTSHSGQHKNQTNEDGHYCDGVTVGFVEVKHLYIYNIFFVKCVKVIIIFSI